MGSFPGQIRFAKNKHYRIGSLYPDSDRNAYEPKFKQRPGPISISGKSLIQDDGVTTFDAFLNSPSCAYPQNHVVGIYEIVVEGEVARMVYLGEGNPRKLATKNGLSDAQAAPVESMQAMVAPRDAEYDAARKSISDAIKTYIDQIDAMKEMVRAIRDEADGLRIKLAETETELRKEINDLTAANIKLTYKNQALEELHTKIKEEGLSDGPSMTESIINGVMQFATTPEISGFLGKLFGGLTNKMAPGMIAAPDAPTAPQLADAAPTPAVPMPPQVTRIEY